MAEMRPAIIKLHEKGYSTREIEQLLEKACSKPHPNVESLKKALKKAWKEISLETLIKAVDDFPKRLKACIDANGGHFE
uniref:Uncharacterized protein n=1 Tax=Acrobeloides nanus TaxID=290746 RepID=A0A914CH48_9BILA